LIDAAEELELIRRARAGSLPCFSQIVRLYERRICNFHLRRVGCASDAEDLTQETFARAWQNLHRFDPERRFATWLFTIAARLAATQHRTRERRRRHLQVRATLERTRDHDHDRNSTRDEARRVWDIAEAVLTPEQRSGLWLRYFEDLRIDEIARVLGKTRVAVRVMLFRARERVAAELERSRAAAPTTRTPEVQLAEGVS
jgi:RNA polymerase sigma-70 factor (ECF subfamily)